MYRVAYYITGSSVAFREFETFAEAIDFSNKQPINSVIEIKKYDDKVDNIQNQSYDPR